MAKVLTKSKDKSFKYHISKLDTCDLLLTSDFSLETSAFLIKGLALLSRIGWQMIRSWENMAGD